MKKIIQKFFQMLSNPSGKLKLKSNQNPNLQKCHNVRYFEARMFYNDLDDPEDYYLKVSSSEKNEFVKKDTIKNGNIH